MAKENSESFKLRLDVDELEPSPPEEEEPSSEYLELRRRLNVLGWLMFVLIALLAGYGYLHLQQLAVSRAETEAKEVERLSGKVDTRLAELAYRVDSLEKELSSRIDETVKTFQGFKANLDQVTTDMAAAAKDIARLDKAKADRQEQQQSLKAAEKAVAPLRQKVDRLSDKLTEVETKLDSGMSATDELSDRIDAASRTAAAAQQDVARLKQRKIDRETLELEMLKEKKKNQLFLEGIAEDLRQRLAAVEKKLTQLEKTADSASRSAPARPAAKPAPDTIIEQEIKE